jgi:hypothetical protein
MFLEGADLDPTTPSSENQNEGGVPSKSKVSQNAWIGIAISFILGCVALAILPLLTTTPNARIFDLIVGIQLCGIPLLVAWIFGKRWGLWNYVRDNRETAIEGAHFQEQDETQTDKDVRRTTISIAIFGGVGLLSICLLAVAAITPFSWKHFCKVIGLGFIYAGAFFGAGALVGFLFGIPRSLQGGRSKQGSSGADVLSHGVNPAFATNTNLEEISDWLTKIIVGLGLINLKAVPGLLKTAAWYFGNFCGTEFCEAASLGLILYFAVCGFFLGYLITRLFLTGAFTRAEASGTVGGPATKDNEEIKETTVPIEIVPKGDGPAN